MERVVLHTSVLIAIERGLADLPEYAREGDDLSVAAISAAELLVGVERASASARGSRHGKVEAMLSALPVLPYDLPAARAHAELIAFTATSGRPRGAHDLLIAATAKAHGRTVVTLDGRGFEGLPGVRVRGD